MISKQERKDLERKIEALIIAIPREAESYDFYMQLAREYSDHASKEMFTLLADQEKKHQETLQGILADLEKKLAQSPA